MKEFLDKNLQNDEVSEEKATVAEAVMEEGDDAPLDKNVRLMSPMQMVVHLSEGGKQSTENKHDRESGNAHKHVTNSHYYIIYHTAEISRDTTEDNSKHCDNKYRNKSDYQRNSASVHKTRQNVIARLVGSERMLCRHRSLCILLHYSLVDLIEGMSYTVCVNVGAFGHVGLDVRSVIRLDLAPLIIDHRT